MHQTSPTSASRTLDNLVAFTRLLGYVRHFHPSDQAAAADWNSLAARGALAAERCRSADELADALGQWIEPVAPRVEVFPTGRPPADGFQLSPSATLPGLEIAHWRHVGCGQGVDADFEKRMAKHAVLIYRSERIRVPAAPTASQSAPSPTEPLEADLGGGVSARVPIALWADARGTLPHVDASPAASASAAPACRQRADRYAAIALAWNVLQHFYPYFDVVETDWVAALRASLVKAARDADDDDFLQTLDRLVAEIHDCHGGVIRKEDRYKYRLPIRCQWIEHKLVITALETDARSQGLAIGDVILALDQHPALDVLLDIEKGISAATPQWKRIRAIMRLLYGRQGSVVRLLVESSGANPRSVDLARTEGDSLPPEVRPPVFAELRPGIVYYDLDRGSDDDFRSALPQLAAARGIVFDLRGYPKGFYTYFHHLIDAPIRSALWTLPITLLPDRRATEFTDGEEGRWTIEPQQPRFKARVAFLTVGRAVSYAESCLGIVEAYKLGDIVGETTAGTNGNVNIMALPGGYQVSWTGMRVLKHDGSQHHGVGIAPTIPVSRTIAGVAAGRDEVLERALAAVDA